MLLLGGGLYVFFAGMARIHWDVGAMLGPGQTARLFTPADHEVPWTALVILMLSTNVWYYATNLYINQRCLATIVPISFLSSTANWMAIKSAEED